LGTIKPTGFSATYTGEEEEGDDENVDGQVEEEENDKWLGRLGQ